MKVICLGLPRTGTSSLARALEILFPDSKTLHGVKFAENITRYDIDNIYNFLNGNFENYVNYMSVYNFILDIPSILFFEESLNKFENDKFIFTYRDCNAFAESWSEYMKLSLSIVENNKFKNILESGNPLFLESMDLFNRCRSHKFKFSEYTLQDAIFDTKIGATLYNNYETYITNLCKNKAKNILFYDINSGWEPLCGFLKTTVPKQLFPHTHKLTEHKKQVENFHKLFTK